LVQLQAFLPFYPSGFFILSLVCLDPRADDSAKSTCDCLMQIRMISEISQFVRKDNPSYNTVHLTVILLDKIGCYQILITHGHSEGNTLAGHAIGTTVKRSYS